MNNKKKNEDPNMIKRLLACMDFAVRLKIAQEDNKKNKKKSNK